MKTKTVNIYTFDELTDAAKERARDWYREGMYACDTTAEDMGHSVKALIKAMGLTLKDWSLGDPRDCYIKVDLGEAAELKGARVLSWLENNLFKDLRVYHDGTTLRRWKPGTNEHPAISRKDAARYHYAVGKMPPCPLTGWGYDDMLLEYLEQNAVTRGWTLEDLIKSLADEASRIVEEEREYQAEDAQVDESIRANGYTFLESGKRED